MIMRKTILSAIAVSASVAAGPASSQGFDPRQPCSLIIGNADEATLDQVGAWIFGYLASSESAVRPVSRDNLNAVIRNLGKQCVRDQTATLLELVGGDKATGGDTGKDAPGSESDARALLMRFFDPQEDLVALTAELLPKPEDVHAVYRDPLASKMIEAYAAAFKPGIKFGPKPEHDDLYMVYTTTAKLVAGDPVLDEFPGGYKEILQYFKTDVPIVRFKFVKKGETLGLAFDGLVYVNGHWVILPKPWRALEQ